MKYILYFTFTLLLLTSVSNLQAQDSLSYDLSSPEFILKEPTLKFDQSIELRALRNAYYIVIDNNNLRFYTEDLNRSEEYNIKFKSLTPTKKTSIVRYNIDYGPFRRLQILYKEVVKGEVSCTLKFYDITGKMIYSASTEKLTNYEEIKLENEFDGVK